MSHKIAIHTKQAPAAIGPYSQAIQSGNTLYLSGQVPFVPDTMTLHAGDFTEQVRQIFKNLQAVCQAAGGDLNNILKLTIYLTDLNNFADVNTVMQEFFIEPYPARTTIQVSALPKGATVEMDAIAVLD